MATYSITAPDGNTYEIQGPEGASQEAIQREVLRQFPGSGAKSELRASYPSGNKDGATTDEDKPSHGWSGLGSGLMGAAQGASFGFGDELAGLYKTYAPTVLGGDEKNRSYDDNVADMRRSFDEAREDNPNAYLAGDVGGSVATSLIPGVGLLGKGAQGASLLGNAGRAALAGAAAGGLRGAGDGDDLASRLGNAGMGAVLGGATGGVMGGVASPLAAAGRGINNLTDSAVRLGGDAVEAMGNGVSSIMRGSRNPAIKALASKYPGGLSSLIDNAADAGLGKLGQVAPRTAGMLGDAFNSSVVGGGPGMVARHALGAATGGTSYGAEAAARGIGYGAEGIGNALGSRASSVAAGRTEGSFLDADRPPTGPQFKDPSDEELAQMAMSTKWAPAIQEAQQKGPMSLKSSMYVLKRNPEFRKELGLDDDNR